MSGVPNFFRSTNPAPNPPSLTHPLGWRRLARAARTWKFSQQKGMAESMSAKRNLGWLAAAGGVALMLSSCSTASTTTTAASATTGTAAKIACKVGIAMPTRSLERWINDGEGLQTLLKAAGCTADLQYADNKTDQQISQIQNMVTNGDTILVIAAIDGTTLGPVLQTAADAKRSEE